VCLCVVNGYRHVLQCLFTLFSVYRTRFNSYRHKKQKGQKTKSIFTRNVTSHTTEFASDALSVACTFSLANGVHARGYRKRLVFRQIDFHYETRRRDAFDDRFSKTMRYAYVDHTHNPTITRYISKFSKRFLSPRGGDRGSREIATAPRPFENENGHDRRLVTKYLINVRRDRRASRRCQLAVGANESCAQDVDGYAARARARLCNWPFINGGMSCVRRSRRPRHRNDNNGRFSNRHSLCVRDCVTSNFVFQRFLTTTYGGIRTNVRNRKASTGIKKRGLFYPFFEYSLLVHTISVCTMLFFLIPTGEILYNAASRPSKRYRENRNETFGIRSYACVSRNSVGGAGVRNSNSAVRPNGTAFSFA